MTADNVRTPEELAAEQEFERQAQAEANELAQRSLAAAVTNAGGADASA